MLRPLLPLSSSRLEAEKYSISASLSRCASAAGLTHCRSKSAATAARPADGAVINPKIAARAITADKINSDPASSGFVLAADGTGGAQWVDNATAPGAGSITTDMLADGAVATPKLADGAVNLATKVS